MYYGIKKLVCFFMLFWLGVLSAQVQAHGERAQQAGLRMRTIHFFDTEIYPIKLSVNEELTVKGKFIPSEYWPEHISSIEEMAFLNIGIPGPKFVRLESRVNGVPMIRSTSFKRGELYEYEIRLKARNVGRYHVHSVISVEGAGPLIGPGLWVEVTPGDEPFENKLTTLFNDEIDLETYGMDEIVFWSALWFVIGGAWFAYWLFKAPIIGPRFRAVNELGDDADSLITKKDSLVGLLFLVVTLVVILYGYLWAEDKYPVTTPLQTGKVTVPLLEWNKDALSVELKDARYRIPGRSFQVEVYVQNNLSVPVRLAEFATANIRFGNPQVRVIKARDSHDLIADSGLVVEDDQLLPGERRLMAFQANDALWETYRLTSLIFDPDSRFAGMLFFEEESGERHPVEIGGAMLPVFK